MKLHQPNKPDFFILGAQKAGTTWLWQMLDQHPGTSLIKQKEIQYFGSAELYARGTDWYLEHFADLESDKVIGDGSTTYFYDRIPYFHNKSRHIEFDDTLPPLPKAIIEKFPNAKFIVSLRDPVRRAVSSYLHYLKKGRFSPRLGLEKVAKECPKFRILEYGYYGKYLKTWMRHVPADRLRVVIFETQIRRNWDTTLTEIYDYLGLDPSFRPQAPNRPVNKSWGWSRILFDYYARKMRLKRGRARIGKILDRIDLLPSRAVKPSDIEFLRSVYLPQKEELATLLGNDLSCWDYGESMLSGSSEHRVSGDTTSKSRISGRSNLN